MMKKTALGFEGTLKFRTTIIIDEMPEGLDLYNAGLPDDVEEIDQFMIKLSRLGVKCHLQYDLRDELQVADDINYEWDDVSDIYEEED